SRAPPGSPCSAGWELALPGGARLGPRTTRARDRPLRCPAASYPCLPLRTRPWDDSTHLYVLDAVAAGLSGPGHTAEPRRTDPRPCVRSPLQCGACPEPGCRAPSLSPGGPASARAGSGSQHPLDRSRVCAVGAARYDSVWLDASRTGTEGTGVDTD